MIWVIMCCLKCLMYRTEQNRTVLLDVYTYVKNVGAVKSHNNNAEIYVCMAICTHVLKK